jgi:hypothetical protein
MSKIQWMAEIGLIIFFVSIYIYDARRYLRGK